MLDQRVEEVIASGLVRSAVVFVVVQDGAYADTKPDVALGPIDGIKMVSRSSAVHTDRHARRLCASAAGHIWLLLTETSSKSKGHQAHVITSRRTRRLSPGLRVIFE